MTSFWTTAGLPEGLNEHVSDPCLLCQSQKPVFVGLYVPKKSQVEQLGLLLTQHLAFPYTLCQNCYDLPDAAQGVEAIALKHLPGVG
jgi:hypothetical protein